MALFYPEVSKHAVIYCRIIYIACKWKNNLGSGNINVFPWILNKVFINSISIVGLKSF